MKILLKGEFIEETHKEICSICKKDTGGKFLIIPLPQYKKYIAICEKCVTTEHPVPPMKDAENWQSNIVNIGDWKKSEDEVRAKILSLTDDNKHVLDCGPATVEINAPRALMQLASQTQLDVLYWFLGEKRPRFKCDDRKLIDR